MPRTHKKMEMPRDSKGHDAMAMMGQLCYPSQNFTGDKRISATSIISQLLLHRMWEFNHESLSSRVFDIPIWLAQHFWKFIILWSDLHSDLSFCKFITGRPCQQNTLAKVNNGWTVKAKNEFLQYTLRQELSRVFNSTTMWRAQDLLRKDELVFEGDTSSLSKEACRSEWLVIEIGELKCNKVQFCFHYNTFQETQKKRSILD